MSEAVGARRGGVSAHVIAFIVAAAAAFALLVVTDTDISVWQDFRRDVFVRDSYRLDEIADIRFADSSPYAIWLSSDLFVWRSLRSGTLPLWDPAQAGGYSPLLNVQNGVMHPVRWMAVAVPFEHVPSFLIVLELLLLALGAHLMLARVFALAPDASACGALTLALCGYTMSVVQFSGALLPLLHVPWIVWAWFGWSETHRRRYAISMIGFVSLLFLAGHPLLIAVSVMTAALSIVWIAASSHSARDIAWASLFSAIALPLAAFVVLPALYGAADSWSYKLNSPAGLPYQVREETLYRDSFRAMLIYEPGDRDKLDDGTIAYFLGPVVLLLALAGFARAFASRRTALAALLAVSGFLLSTPPDPLVRLVRATPLAYFKPWYLMFPLALGIAAATAFAAATGLARLRGRWRPAGAVVMFALIVLSLRPVTLDGFSPAELRSVGNPILERLEREAEPFRVVGLRGQTHLPNAGAITGLEDVRFSSPMLPSRYREWFRIAGSRAVDDSFPTTILPAEVDSPLYGAFNVKFVLRSRLPGDEVQTFLPRSGERPPRGYASDPVPDPATHPEVMARPSIALHENRLHYHARAHFASEAVVVEPGLTAAVRAMRESSTRGVEVLEAGDRVSAGALPDLTRPLPGDSVTVRYPSARRVEIATRSEAARILVLHDAWDPGWRVRIDGNRADAFPVSLISRGVFVPAGTHDVEMTYFPRGFVAGVCISIITALAITSMALRGPIAKRMLAG